MLAGGAGTNRYLVEELGRNYPSLASSYQGGQDGHAEEACREEKCDDEVIGWICEGG